MYIYIYHTTGSVMGHEHQPPGVIIKLKRLLKQRLNLHHLVETNQLAEGSKDAHFVMERVCFRSTTHGLDGGVSGSVIFMKHAFRPLSFQSGCCFNFK